MVDDYQAECRPNVTQRLKPGSAAQNHSEQGTLTMNQFLMHSCASSLEENASTFTKVKLSLFLIFEVQ